MKFRGSNSPEVYILDFHSEENPLEEYPMAGPRGDFLLSLLGSFSLLDKTRLANITMQGKDIVEDDILEKNPKVIVGFGSEALKTYLDTKKKISEVSGQVFDIEIKGVTFKFLIMMSPSYILRKLEDSSLTIKYSQDLYKAFQVVQGEFKDVLKEKEILSAHSFEEFLNIYETRFKDDPEVAYDIETNARPPMFEGSRIIGFSVGNKTSGVYVSVDSLDFHMLEDEETQIWEFVINEVFEKKSKLIIHNTMYERPYTLYCKGYEIKFDKAHDTLVMARLLRNPKEGAGLKYQAQKYLQYPDWETDLTQYISGFRSIVDRLVFGPKKFGGLLGAVKSSIFEIEDTDKYLAMNKKDQEEISEILSRIKSPMVDLYSEDEIFHLGKLIFEKVQEVFEQGGIKDSTIPYNWIPDRLLSKYGAVDSLATFDLKDYFFKVMDEESTDKVDLHKGYQNWLEHMYVAYIMERNGMYWNEVLASKDRDYLSDQATRCLRDMLLSPIFETCIEEVAGWRYKPIILSDYLPQIAFSQNFEVNYDRLTEKYTLKFNGKRVSKDRISEIVIPSDQMTTYSGILKELFYEEVKGAKGFEELKEIYNPSSSSESHIAFRCLITPELQDCHKILSLATLAKSPEFEGEVTESLPVVDRKFLSAAKLLEDEDTLKSTYGEEWAEYRKQIYLGFLSLLKTHGSKVQTPEIKEAISSKNKFIVEALDDPGVISLYNCLRVTGIDKDNPSTWTDQFKWMIDYRLFKKSMKLISSYIDGSVGRGSVAIVDEDELKRGDHCLERKANYYDRKLEGKETYVLNTKWGPNTAETGRWRSAIHTIPFGSQVKKYYTSRFPGGTMLMPDYCLTGDTKIRLLDGRQVTLEDLYTNGETEFEVYSYNTNNRKVVVGKAHGLSITKKVNEVYEIVLDNGQSIKCTGNHPFLSLEGEYIRADNLEIGTSLQPCNFRYSNDEKCIALRKLGRDTNARQCIEETFAKLVLSGIVVSEYTWDELISTLRIKKSGCSGNSRKNVIRVYGSFVDFINSMKNMIPEQYYEEVLFRTEFENKVGRVRSKTYKTYYNNFETLGLKVEESTWEDCISILRGARDSEGYKVVDPHHLPHLSQITRLNVTFGDLRRYCRQNHRVVEIKVHHLEEEIPVYDLQVDDYHNFLVCAGENSGVFVHNSQMEVRSLAAVSHDENMLELFRSGRDFHTETAKSIFQKEEVTPGERRFSKTATFSLLYGAMESSFAKNYCNGNMSMANEIYQGFFRAYPQVQEWIAERHAEVARDHRVSLDLSNRFIKIEVDSNDRGAEASMKRKAQNYPIQATSADLTGCVVYDIQKFIEDNDLRALIVMYVHDSIEIDLPPFELIHFVAELKKILINSPLERMGLPSQADVALGYSLGHEIDMTDIETNESFTECTMTLKGYWDEIEETVENWKTAYAVVEVFDEDFKEIYVSMSELFILRKAYTPTIGTHRKKGTCKVHIKYYN